MRSSGTGINSVLGIRDRLTPKWLLLRDLMADDEILDIDLLDMVAFAQREDVDLGSLDDEAIP